MLCASGGWFPAPKVQWRDTKGKALPSSSESLTQDAAGLFHVEATLLVTDRDVGSVVCSIQNPLSEQEEVKGILLPGRGEPDSGGGRRRKKGRKALSPGQFLTVLAPWQSPSSPGRLRGE